MWALRLGVALYRYWEHREYLAEGRTWLEAILELPGDAEASTATRVGALSYVSAMALDRAILASRMLRTREALEMCRARRPQGRDHAAQRALRPRTLARKLPGSSGVGRADAAGVWRSWRQGSHCSGPEQSRGRHFPARPPSGGAGAPGAGVCDVCRDGRCDRDGLVLQSPWRHRLGLGDIAEARRLYEAGADIFRKTDNRWGLARSACDLGHLACEEANYDSARAFFRSALTVFRELEHKRGLALAFEGLARLAREEAEPARALTLAGAAAALRRASGAVVRSEDDRKLERTRDRAFAQGDPARSKQAWTKGWHMPTDEALQHALMSSQGRMAPGSADR